MSKPLDIVIHGRSGFDILIESQRIVPQLYDRSQLDYILVMVGSWVKLLDDSPLCSGAQFKPVRVFRKFLNEIYYDGLKNTVLRYAELADTLLHNCVIADGGTSTGAFIDAMRHTPIFMEYFHWLRSGDSKLLDYITSFCYHIKKVQLDDPELETNALRAWLTVEERLSRLDVRNTEMLREIIKELLPEPTRETVHYPKFGPGCVAEKEIGRSLQRKIKNLSFDPRLKRLLSYPHSAVLATLADITGSPDCSYSDSRTIFVRKDLKKHRSVGMEPSTRMLAQQLVLDIMKTSISLGGASGWIRLRDQTWNQKLSEYGSATNEIDTIDLSFASDSVAWELVMAVFPSWLLPYLAATRSTATNYEGKRIPLVKFAPMGSAVCFPVECVLFTGIVLEAAMLYARIHNRERNLTVSRLLKMFDTSIGSRDQVYRSLGVYGDDICVDSKLTPYVLFLLELYGFSINREKSFTGDRAFRESCGEFFLGGDRIGITRNPLWSWKTFDSASYAGMMAYANHLGDAHYVQTRSFVINLLRRRYKMSPHFTTDRDQPGLFTTRSQPTNTGARTRRWNGDVPGYQLTTENLTSKVSTVIDQTPSYLRFQRDEVRAQVVVPSKIEKRDLKNENEEAYHYMGQNRAGRRNEEKAGEQPVFNRRFAMSNSIGWRWMPIR